MSPRKGHAAPVVRAWEALRAQAAATDLVAWVGRYLEHQRMQGDSDLTLVSRHGDLRRFVLWCDERELRAPGEIHRPILERYQRHLFHFRQPRNGQPLSVNRQRQSVSHLTLFFGWLVRRNVIPFNPAADLDVPRARRGQLIDPLSHEEVERVLARLDVSHPYELRDRAMLEVLYSTGLRRAELVRLSLYDVDRSRGTVFVNQGKGGRDRHVPIGERALAWLDRYADEVRPQWVVDASQTTLFLNQHGEPLDRNYLGHRVRVLIRAAGIPKPGACHLFRHAMATQMLEHGADVRYVQEMLGHASLATTQVYTHVSIAKLKEIHGATHPAAKLARRPPPVGPDEAGGGG